MSNDFRRKTAPDSARKLAAQVAEHMPLPEDVAAALAHLDAVEGIRPKDVTPADLTAAYEDANARTVERVARDLSSIEHRRRAWSEARTVAGLALRSAITSNGDRITRALAEVAAPLIDALNTAAKLRTLDVAALLREGERDAADLVVSLDLTAANLTNLYTLRGRVTQGAEYGVDGFTASHWQRPDIAAELTKRFATNPPAKPVDLFLTGIKAGAGLWFPTPAEAEAVAAPYAREAAKKAEERKQRAWGIGSYVG